MFRQVLAGGYRRPSGQIKRFAFAVVVGLLVVATNLGLVLADEPSIAWDAIEPIATATGQDVTSLKVFDDATHLHFLVEGTNLSATNTQMFINIDGNPSTGHAYWQWGSAGFEYLVENNQLFRYVEGSGDWPWPESPDNPTIGYTKTDTSIEITVSKSLLGTIADTIYVGFVLRNENWTTTGALPRLLPAAYELVH